MKRYNLDEMNALFEARARPECEADGAMLLGGVTPRGKRWASSIPNVANLQHSKLRSQVVGYLADEIYGDTSAAEALLELAWDAAVRADDQPGAQLVGALQNGTTRLFEECEQVMWPLVRG